MHFYLFYSTNGMTQGGDGGVHTLLFIDLLHEYVFLLASATNIHSSTLGV